MVSKSGWGYNFLFALATEQRGRRRVLRLWYAWREKGDAVRSRIHDRCGPREAAYQLDRRGRLSGQYPSRPAPAHRWPTIIVRSALGRDFVS
jgi:hypothetical protein